MANRTLAEYLDSAGPARFQSKPSYFKDGDFVTFFLKNDLFYAQRVDDLLTVYVSEDTGDMIGCKIKSVSRLMKRIGDFAVSIEDLGGKIKLGFLFLTAATMTELSRRAKYKEVAKKIGDVELDTESLPAMAA